MTKIKTYLGYFFLLAGILAMSGAANDCDGACMETANDLPTFLMVAFLGLTMFATGAFILIKEMAE